MRKALPLLIVLIFLLAASGAAAAAWRAEGAVTPSDRVTNPFSAGVDAQGNLFTAFQPDRAPFVARSRPAGGPLGAERELTTAFVRTSDVAVAPSGRAVAVWSEAEGDRIVVAADDREPQVLGSGQGS